MLPYSITLDWYFALNLQDESIQPSSSGAIIKQQLRRELDALYPQIFRMISAMTYGSGLDADDITQDVFMKAWRKAGSFHSGSTLTTWVYAIARNTVIDASRKQRIRNIVTGFWKTADNEDGYEMEAADPSADVVENRELREILRKSIAELPEIYKSVIIFREVQGLTYDQIAAITGDNEGTLKSRLFHAKAKLREILTKKGYHYDSI